MLKQLPLLFVDRAVDVIDDGARFVCAPNHRTLKNGRGVAKAAPAQAVGAP